MMKKQWPRGILLGLTLALILAGGVALVQAQDFPLGDRSFADQVVGFGPGTDTEFPYDNPQAAIGPEDECGENAVALGFGGTLTVKFTDNYLIDVDGDDLYVFECGPAVEPFQVEISKDGSDWIDLGTVTGQPTSLDIHDVVAPGDRFSYVRITDANADGSGGPFGGADITAVGAIGAEEKVDTDGDGVTATQVAPTATATPLAPSPTHATGPLLTPTPTEAWASACASGETNIGEASIFRRAKFTIGGTEPQEVRITSPAENFAIVKEYGGLVYQRIKGQDWGTLTLEPGSYILSCSGSGPLGLMRATVCIQYPVVAEGPTGPEEEGFPEVEHPPQPPAVPSGDIAKPSLPLGRIDRIIVRPSIVRRSDNLVAEVLVMEIGEEKRFIAFGVDAAWREGADDHIKNVTVDDWEVSDGDESIGSIDQEGLFRAKAEGNVTIKATAEKMTGVFSIEVMEQPPIIFEGWVHFFDESGGRVKPFADVPVEIKGWTDDYPVCDGDVVWEVRTDPTGGFRFVLPARVVLPWGSCEVYTKDMDTWGFGVSTNARAPTGYSWSRDPVSVDFQGPGKPGETLRLAQALGLKLTKLPEPEFYLEGDVTHRGLPVEGATVWLLHNGRVVETKITDDSGIALFSVRGLEGGKYRITAKCRPPKWKGDPDPGCWPPGRPGGRVTLHDWLINRGNIWVDLPMTEPKTINIPMVSWADKIGYTLP